MENKNLIDEIVVVTANVFCVTPDGVRGRRMNRVFTDARYLAMYIARQRGEYIDHIAQYFEVSIQAVSAGINKTRERLKIYDSLRGRHDRILRILANNL